MRVKKAAWAWALSRIAVEPGVREIAGEAIELLETAGLHGHKYAVDAALAAGETRDQARRAGPAAGLLPTALKPTGRDGAAAVMASPFAALHGPGTASAEPAAPRQGGRYGGAMADYSDHAHKARKLLEESEKKTGRHSVDQLIAAAQVEALLALAVAVAGRQRDAGPE